MKRSLIVLGVLAFGCGDCGEEPGLVPDDDATITATEDTGLQVDDLGSSPDNFPGFVEVRVEPGTTTYRTGDDVTVAVRVYDLFGDLAEYDTTVTIDPANAVSATDDGYTITAEGVVTFTACTVELGREGDPICNADVVVVDDAPPAIELTFPTPGAELDATMYPTVPITGNVTDSHGEPRVFVNGEEVAVIDGAFSTEMTPTFGINHVTVEASDGLNDRTTIVGADVMWAADYQMTTGGEPDIFFRDGLRFRLGQTMLDDGAAPVQNADGSIDFGDVADILKLVVERIDASGVVPDPVVDNAPTFFLRIPSISVGSVISEVRFTEDGLEAYLRLPNLTLTTLGGIEINNQTLSLNGTITASVAAIIDVSISKTDGAAPIRVSIEDVFVAVESATSQFQSAEANAIFIIASSALRTTIENVVTDALSDSFLDELPAIFESLFEDLGDAITSNTIELDTGFGSPITLSLFGGLEKISLTDRDGMEVEARLLAQTDVAGIHDSRGIPLMTTDASPQFFESDLEIGLRLALVNGILSILWDAGILDLDVSDAVPIMVDRADLAARLPPVIRPALNGEPNDLVIELGQLELSTELLGKNDVYGIYISTGIDITLDGAGLSVTVADTPTIETWIISSSDETALLGTVQLEGLIRSQLWPEIQAVLADGISVPIPAFDLGSLSSVSPDLAGATLEIKGGRETSTRTGYTMVDGVLEGHIP